MQIKKEGGDKSESHDKKGVKCYYFDQGKTSALGIGDNPNGICIYSLRDNTVKHNNFVIYLITIFFFSFSIY